MAVKTANVNTRIQSEIKEQAETILDRLGIPRSVAIDIFYRQIIAHNGIPFPLTLPIEYSSRKDLSDIQFDQMMATGLRQAKGDDSFDVDEVFSELEKSL